MKNRDFLDFYPFGHSMSEGTPIHFFYPNRANVWDIPLCLGLSDPGIRNPGWVGEKDWRKVTCSECVSAMWYHRIPRGLKWYEVEWYPISLESGRDSYKLEADWKFTSDGLAYLKMFHAHIGAELNLNFPEVIEAAIEELRVTAEQHTQYAKEAVERHFNGK